MIHEMNLRPGPFEEIASGRKAYELRLLDEKRKAIQIGDFIRFIRTTDQAQIMVHVVSLHPFDNFSALYAAMPLEKCGYTAESATRATPSDMEAYYPLEKQAAYGVIAIGIERIRLPLHKLNQEYSVRELTAQDVNGVLRVAESNPLYYEHLHTQPDAAGILNSMQALPPGRTTADKYFFGWYEGDRLVAIMDLILHYPRENVAFIGWFMVDATYQHRGVGTKLVSDVICMLQEAGMLEVRLGRVMGNPQSEGFWRVNGFIETGASYETDGYTVIVMVRMLNQRTYEMFT